MTDVLNEYYEDQANVVSQLSHRSDSFARSLILYYNSHGELTPKQYAAVVPPKNSATVTEPGVYVDPHSKTVYKVSESKSGHLYASEMVEGPDGSIDWEYVGAKPIRSLTDTDKITAEHAAEIGHQIGACVFCSKTLTHPVSVKVGYGPTCADNHGLPWG